MNIAEEGCEAVREDLGVRRLGAMLGHCIGGIRAQVAQLRMPQ